jgi:hypothetical protein
MSVSGIWMSGCRDLRGMSKELPFGTETGSRRSLRACEKDRLETGQ